MSRSKSLIVSSPPCQATLGSKSFSKTSARLTACEQYLPTTGDLVIGTIRGGTADFYYVSIADHSTNALLPNLAFESATKKTRPILANGALVYARVSAGLDANKHMDATLECVYPSTGRADGLGPLTDGMVFGVSLGLARRLLMPRPLEDGGVAVLAELEAAGAAFETAVGRNGRVWVDAADVRTVVAVGRALTETDERRLDVDAQRRLARRIIKDLSG